MIESHESNLKRVEFELLRWIRNQGRNSNLTFQSGTKNGLLLETKEIRFFLPEIRGVESTSTIKTALKKVHEMKVIDRTLKKKLKEIEEVRIQAAQKGYFNAEEYLKWKDQLSDLSGVVDVRGRRGGP